MREGLEELRTRLQRCCGVRASRLLQRKIRACTGGERSSKSVSVMSVLSGIFFIFCVHIWIRLLLFLFSVQIWLLSVFFFLWPIFGDCRSQMREFFRSQQLRQDSSAYLLSVFLLLCCCFRSADEPRPVLLTSLNGFFPGYS